MLNLVDVCIDEESAVHNQKSKDMLLSCEKLIDFSKKWPPSKSFVDSMIIHFIIEMIKNNDVPFHVLKKIYRKQNVKRITQGYRIQKVFSQIALFNFLLAYGLVSLHLRK